MPSAFAVIGDTQFLPGYCILLAEPEVGHLNDLDLDRRQRFLADMSLLGDAIGRACTDDGLRRLNYEVLGNGLPCLHALSDAHEPLRRRIAEALDDVLADR